MQPICCRLTAPGSWQTLLCCAGNRFTHWLWMSSCSRFTLPILGSMVLICRPMNSAWVPSALPGAGQSAGGTAVLRPGQAAVHMVGRCRQPHHAGHESRLAALPERMSSKQQAAGSGGSPGAAWMGDPCQAQDAGCRQVGDHSLGWGRSRSLQHRETTCEPVWSRVQIRCPR